MSRLGLAIIAAVMIASDAYVEVNGSQKLAADWNKFGAWVLIICGILWFAAGD